MFNISPLSVKLPFGSIYRNVWINLSSSCDKICSLIFQMTSWKEKLRSSHLRCSVRKGVLRNFAKFTSKHLCQSLFFNKVAGLRQHYFKRDSGTGVFLLILRNFQERLFIQNTSGRLVLESLELIYNLMDKDALDSFLFLISNYCPVSFKILWQ